MYENDIKVFETLIREGYVIKLVRKGRKISITCGLKYGKGVKLKNLVKLHFVDKAVFVFVPDYPIERIKSIVIHDIHKGVIHLMKIEVVTT